MLTKDDVEAIVKPHYDRIIKTYQDAMEDYSKHYNDTRHIHSPITRANLFRDHVVDHARRNFTDVAGADPRDKSNGLFYIELDGKAVGIDGSVAMRFKKLNKKLLTSNVPTRQSNAFNAQLPVCGSMIQGELFGVPIVMHRPEPTHVNAGYLPNELWTVIESLFVTCPNGKYKLEFFLKVYNEQAGTQATVYELPVTPEIQPTRKRVRPKKKDKDKADGSIN